VLTEEKAAGFLELERANVRWFLSIDYDDIPQPIRDAGKRTYRLLTMNNEEVEFSEGFTDLHTDMYREIIAGKGYGIADARNSIDIVYRIRNDSPVGLTGDYHPLLKKV
jgi:UDP-N-acetyl-2-amino-2-deoxyglucuronate dehydrogenase